MRRRPIEEAADPGRLQLWLVFPPIRVLLGLVDGVVFARPMLHREAAREGLDVRGLRFRGRMRLAGLLLRFETRHVLGSCKREQVALLGRIEEIGGGNASQSARLQIFHLDHANPVAGHIRRDRLVPEQNREPPGADLWREHLFDHGDRDSRLMRELRDPAPAGIEIGDGLPLFTQRIIAPVVFAHGLPIAAVGERAAEHLDPWMLIRRDGLRGELASQPIGLFGDDDTQAVASGCQRSGAPAGPAAEDGHVTAQLVRGGEIPGNEQNATNRREEISA